MPVFSSKSEKRIICQPWKENQTKMHKQEKKKKINILQVVHLHHSFGIETKQKNCFVLSDNLARRKQKRKDELRVVCP